MKEQKPARMPRFPTLLKEYERYLNKRIQAGEITKVTKDTYLNDANRVLEALVFATEQKDIQEAMAAYGYHGYYGNIIRELRQDCSATPQRVEILRRGSPASGFGA